MTTDNKNRWLLSNNLYKSWRDKIDMDKRKECIVNFARMILETEIENKNYHFLKKAYDKLGLYDNKRIMDMNKKYPKIQARPTEGIFENIMAVILEEIKDDNEELLNLFMKYYLDRFPFVKEAFQKSGSNSKKYMANFKKDADGTDVIKKAFIVLYYLVQAEEDEGFLIYVYEKYKIDFEQFKDKLVQKTYIQSLEELWEIENLAENKIYQKYLKKQRQILADYLKIEPEKLEEYIVYYSAATYKKKDENGVFETGTRGTPFAWIEESLFKIMDKNNISTDCIVGKVGKMHTSIVKEDFENLCGALIYTRYCDYEFQDEELTLSMIIRQASIEDVNTFYVGLLASYYFDLLTRVLNGVLEDYYKIFSFDKILNVNREKELIAEIDKLKDELYRNKEKIKQYAEEEFEQKQKQYSETQKEDRGYVEKIALLEKQLEEQKKLNEKQQQRLKDQEEYISLLEQQDETEQIEEAIDISAFSSKRIVFIGGMQELLVKLKPIFENSVFIKDEAVTVPVNIDAIVMFPKFMNHVLFYKYIALAREKDIKVIYCNSNNMDIVLGEIGKRFSKDNTEKAFGEI